MAEDDLLVGHTALLQHLLRLGAERAAGAGDDADRGRCLSIRIDVAQHGIGIGDLEGVALDLRLDKLLLYHPVLDQHRVAPRALAEAKVRLVDQHAHPLGELTVAIGNKPDIVGFLVLLPRIHDEGIIDRETDDVIHTVGLEYVGQFVKARQVGGGTGRGEGAGQREHHHGLALEQLIRADIAPLTAFTGLENNARYLLSFFALQHESTPSVSS